MYDKETGEDLSENYSKYLGDQIGYSSDEITTIHTHSKACLKNPSRNLHAQLCRISKAAKKKRHTGKFPRRFFFAQIILFTQSLANLRICQLLLPLQQQQLQQQSYQPLGCFLRRSDPSFLREPVQKKNLQTERQNAYVP